MVDSNSVIGTILARIVIKMSVVMAIPRFAYNLPKYVLGLG